jgi:hypothetical protein
MIEKELRNDFFGSKIYHIFAILIRMKQRK